MRSELRGVYDGKLGYAPKVELTVEPGLGLKKTREPIALRPRS